MADFDEWLAHTAVGGKSTACSLTIVKRTAQQATLEVTSDGKTIGCFQVDLPSMLPPELIDAFDHWKTKTASFRTIESYVTEHLIPDEAGAGKAPRLYVELQDPPFRTRDGKVRTNILVRRAGRTAPVYQFEFVKDMFTKRCYIQPC